MADYESSTTVSAPVDTLFDYLSEVGNLPDYFARMTEARRTGPEEVHTTATMPDGSTAEGDVWFRVDDAQHRISWGSQDDDSGYSGYLDVSEAEGGSRVEVHIHSPHDVADEIQQGVDQTVATIKEKVEAQGEGRP